MSSPVLQDYQFWFGDSMDNGLLFGIDTNYDVVSVDGMEALRIRSGTREYPRQDGSVPGLHLVSSKHPIFELETIGDAAYQDFKSTFQAFPNEEGELHFKNSGEAQKFMRARVLARSDFKDGFVVGRQPVTVAFEIADPRIYGTDLNNETIQVFDAGGFGLDWEVDWEIDWAAAGGGGSEVVVTNNGNTKAFPIIKFFGPISGTCLGVELINNTEDVTLRVDTTITTSQILTADMDSRVRGQGTRVLDLSGTSVYGDWVAPRETFYLAPGDNIIRLNLVGASTSTDVIAQIFWRDTYY